MDETGERLHVIDDAAASQVPELVEHQDILPEQTGHVALKGAGTLADIIGVEKAHKYFKQKEANRSAAYKIALRNFPRRR